jgi:KDO2-lipid IV(A) lauroyltransferase
MVTRLALGILWLIHLLPDRALARVGEGIGALGRLLARERRHVAETNLRLCFPNMPEAERAALVRAHFRSLGRALAEGTIAWWGSEARLKRLVRVEGLEHYEPIKDKPCILLAPHFVGLDIAGIRLSIDLDAGSFYSRQKDPVFDAFLVSRRQRFRPVRLISRQEGIKPAIRVLRDGRLLFFPPDLDFGPRESIFVPFFGVQAATIPALSRLARMTGAAVLPVVARQLPRGEGYVAKIYPPFADFPGESIEADTRAMNAFIEERVRETPPQYWWLHKRFKTRPPGEARPY